MGVEDFGSRDQALELPQVIAMLAYLSKQYSIPPYARPSGLQYQYTQASGLKGMVTSGRLWAGDIRFLNDPSEGTFLAEEFFACLSQKTGGLSDEEEHVLSALRMGLKHPRDTYNTYNISFCGDGDLLSQWRGYGGFGTGYAVGFDLTNLPHPQIGALYEVIYGSDRINEIAFDILDIFVQAARKWPGMLPDLTEHGASLIRILGTCFKNPAYREEQETRIIVNHTPGDLLLAKEQLLKFRDRGSDVLPYLDLSLSMLNKEDSEPKLPIKRIVTGPGVDFERNSQSVRALLRNHGYTDVEIVPSQIPFRQ